MTLEKFNEQFKLTALGKELDEKIKAEYQDQFKSANQNLLKQTEELIAALKKHGTEKNFNALFQDLKFKLPRFSYIKNFEIDGKNYDIEIDSLTLEWTIN